MNQSSLPPEQSGTVVLPPMTIHQVALIITAVSLVGCQLHGDVEDALRALMIAKAHYEQIPDGNDWLDSLAKAMTDRWPDQVEHQTPARQQVNPNIPFS